MTLHFKGSHFMFTTLLICLFLYLMLGFLFLSTYIIIQYILKIILAILVLYCVWDGEKQGQSINWINAMIMLVVTTIIPFDPSLTILIVLLCGWMPIHQKSHTSFTSVGYDHQTSCQALLSTKLESAKLQRLHIGNR